MVSEHGPEQPRLRYMSLVVRMLPPSQCRKVPWKAVETMQWAYADDLFTQIIPRHFIV